MEENNKPKIFNNWKEGLILLLGFGTVITFFTLLFQDISSVNRNETLFLLVFLLVIPGIIFVVFLSYITTKKKE